MTWLMVAGGAPMLVMVVFGLVTLFSAGRYAWRPAPGQLGHLLASAGAVLFASLAGAAGDLVMVTVRVTESDEWAHSPNLPLLLLAGFGESLSPLVVGFSILAVAAMLTAVGLRRAG